MSVAPAQLPHTVAPIPSGPLEGEFEEFLLRLHRTLDARETAYTIANDGRALIGCDRVCVLLRGGDGLRLVSVSGVEVPDARSNVIRSIERLSEAVLRTGEPFWYVEPGDETPPQIQAPLVQYVDACQARTAGVIPVAGGETRDARDLLGAMVVECFERVDPRRLAPTSLRVAGHAAGALRNVRDYRRVAWARALLPAWWAVTLFAPGRRRRSVTACVILGALAAVLSFVPADLDVRARGELRPQRRRNVFAPSDGVVEQVLVSHDAEVSAGAPVVVLRDPQLELELQEVLGALRTAQQKRASLEALRLDGREGGPAPGDAQRMSGEEAAARQEVENLERRLSILETRRSRLNVTSPLAGRVVTWNVEELLETRPVRQGQVLLTVADVAGPWELALEVPEREIGHVLQAQRNLRPELAVSYFAASRPEATRAARLDHVALAAEQDVLGEPIVRATATPAGDSTPGGRTGTSITARIQCGRRSVGYVWFHGVWEAIVTRLWY
jgi:biotin carboxyl carrier protein